MTDERRKRDIAEGVLLGTFVADALGAQWEGSGAVSLDEGQARLERSLAAERLRYTDDTQLTLALAEHLIAHPDIEPEALVGTFAEHFEPWRGYARGMHGIVAAWRRGLASEAAARSVFPDGSFGNGAAMRVAPVAIVHADDHERAAAAAARQAAVTHAHPIGVDAAVAQCRAVALAACTGRFGAAELQHLTQLCATEVVAARLGVAADLARECDPGAVWPPDVGAAIGTSVLASESVATALWVAAVAQDFSHTVVLSLALGGDVDTIAAMAAAVLGAALGAHAIPPAWLERLEDGERGLRYARDLAGRLAATAG